MMQNSKLYVGNFKYSTTPNELEELFSPYGEILSVKIIEGKGFGFVEMSTPEAAMEAMEKLNGSDFGGRTLRVYEAHPPKQKPRRQQNRRNFRGGNNNY
jgi:RNA recognition motif-containing protein